ncbi:MAG: 7,8-didemethyl-8-hydroxy-5-deazariboflavin synthase subunit CofG [Nitrospinota bacterium]
MLAQAGGPTLRAITYSRNFTLPVTNWCYNRCSYCSFRQNLPLLLDLEEVERRALEAKGYGAIEALVMTGEGIDLNPRLAGVLRSWGYPSYAAYVARVCQRLLDLGLLPHTNIGTLTQGGLELLGPVNASMGAMLETVSPAAARIAHQLAPTKAPAKRLAMLRWAGELRIPFTTGILIGIGESAEERVRALEAIAEVHARYGHIQEVILQPLNPQPDTPMARWPRPPLEALLELIPACRAIMPDVHVQIPPNLVDELIPLLEAGADDVGGLAHEPDHINPDRPWPKPEALEAALRPHGMRLKLRMPIYEEFVERGWYAPPVAPVLEALCAAHAS